MRKLIKKLHMYTGLFNFTILIVFGIVGLAASFLPPPGERTRPEGRRWEVQFSAPGTLDDRGVADRIHQALKLPLTRPAPDWAIRRDDEADLHVRFFTPARHYEVRFLESEERLFIESIPFDTWQFLFHLHELVPAQAPPDWQMMAWAYYVEVSLWSLVGMTLSGIYLWLVSRPGFLWAQISFSAGIGIFLFLWLWL